MNIWYLNHYSGSVENPKDGRSFYLSKSLNALGNNLTVFASSYHHIMKDDSYKHVKEIITRKEVDGVFYLWLKTPEYCGNGIGRIKNMISYSWLLWKIDFVKKYYINHPDVIIVSSVHPFHLLAGLKWAKKYKAKLVFEVRDLWPLSLNLLLGISKFHPLSVILSILERIGYKKSDLVISPLVNALNYMNRRGLKNEKFLYLPNGFDKSFNWSEKTILDNDLKKIRKQYKRVIMHIGSVGVPNGLEILIDAANKLNNDDVAFILIGNGNLKSKLKSMANSDNIYFFDSIPKNEVQAALKYSDICYCGFQYQPDLYQYGISPNKLFDYMLAQKPVILCVDSPRNIVQLSNCGFNISAKSSVHFQKDLKKILELSEDELIILGNNGKKYIYENHDFSILAHRLVNKLNEDHSFVDNTLN